MCLQNSHAHQNQKCNTHPYAKSSIGETAILIDPDPDPTQNEHKGEDHGQELNLPGLPNLANPQHVMARVCRAQWSCVRVCIGANQRTPARTSVHPTPPHPTPPHPMAHSVARNQSGARPPFAAHERHSCAHTAEPQAEGDATRCGLLCSRGCALAQEAEGTGQASTRASSRAGSHGVGAGVTAVQDRRRWQQAVGSNPPRRT